ncbi:N-acetylglucosamine-6-phosphate deacetylase [Hymenobacter lucidus]|uniref:N-acetylglucosamine-6-phosphate deacetylase n=1 Tax=Hymenobacter lucidus TaxID=2880930 RepID=A0ABS8AYY2_9BACT|nr:N-acetylglucosamine-6-phosphate deacetylase [Hymenobacter lucidus]MCB2411026.1 N-acetylglucosamine-6-phosphate deacetylase [Hymenobacter lucidus]
MIYLLTNCRVYTGDAVLVEHDVLVEGTTIRAIIPQTQRPAQVAQIDGRGLNVCPGFVDVQLYGGGDSAFGLAPSQTALQQLRRHTLRYGTTSFLPTVPTNAPAVVDHALAVVKDALPTMPGLLGLHLEGPYISPNKRGVHPAEFVRVPVLAEVANLLDRGRGVLRMLTLAPEVLGPVERALLQAAGIVLSAGHSDASYEQGMHAFAHGFTAATHLFNAMSPLTGRAPGLVGAVYDDPAVRASIVVDGRHCAYASVRISHRLLGPRLFLISDATAATTTGPYCFRPQDDSFVDAEGTLAGSGLTLMQAVRNCVQHVGLPLAESLRMASLYPAQVLGLDQRLGRIAPGYRADLCLFDEELNVRATVLAGQLQWHEASARPTTPLSVPGENRE